MVSTESKGRWRTFNEKFLVEVREVPASTKRGLYIWSAVLFVVGIAAFLLVLFDVLGTEDLASVDQPFADLMASARSDTLTSVMIALAVIFGPVALPIIILVVTIGWGIFSKHAWRPVLLAGGVLLGLVVIQVLTRLVGRDRPPVDGMLFGTDYTPSFPSGHVMGASDFLLLVAYLVFSRRQKPALAALSFAAAALLIVAASVSRIYLGYHWATDAMASMSLSLAVLGTVIAVDTWRTVRVKGESRPPTSTKAPSAY
ncbi:MAG: phosphatase PAP2 family protein [Pseudolysinimonas sp.]